MLLSHLIYSLVLERNTEAVTQRFFQSLPKLTVNCFLGCVYYTCMHYTCVKTVQIWSFLWSEHGKMWNRKNFVSGHFSQSENVLCRRNLFKYLDCLLIQTIYKFCDMILVGNLNYGYSLISRVYRWHNEGNHMTFPGNTFWCTMSSPKSYAKEVWV